MSTIAFIAIIGVIMWVAHTLEKRLQQIQKQLDKIQGRMGMYDWEKANREADLNRHIDNAMDQLRKDDESK